MTRPIGFVAEFRLPRVPPGPEEGTLREPGLLDVFADGFGRREVKPDATMLVALLVEGDGRLVAVLVEVLDLEPTAGADPGPGVEEELDDRPVAEVEDRVSGRQPHELPGPRRREGLGLVARVGRPARDELGVGRVGDRDREPELGGDPLEVLVEARERGDPPVDGLGGLDSSASIRSRNARTSATETRVWQRFATKWAIRALMSVPTRPCEKRLRLSVRARKKPTPIPLIRRVAVPSSQSGGNPELGSLSGRTSARAGRRQNTLEMPVFG